MDLPGRLNLVFSIEWYRNVSLSLQKHGRCKITRSCGMMKNNELGLCTNLKLTVTSLSINVCAIREIVLQAMNQTFRLQCFLSDVNTYIPTVEKLNNYSYSYSFFADSQMQFEKP